MTSTITRNAVAFTREKRSTLRSLLGIATPASVPTMRIAAMIRGSQCFSETITSLKVPAATCATNGKGLRPEFALPTKWPWTLSRVSRRRLPLFVRRSNVVPRAAVLSPWIPGITLRRAPTLQPLSADDKIRGLLLLISFAWHPHGYFIVGLQASTNNIMMQPRLRRILAPRHFREVHLHPLRMHPLSLLGRLGSWGLDMRQPLRLQIEEVLAGEVLGLGSISQWMNRPWNAGFQEGLAGEVVPPQWPRLRKIRRMRRRKMLPP